MMKSCLLCWLLTTLTLPTLLLAEEPNAKSLKYLSVLQKRPSPGYLFDRFYNAWLDTGTLEGLETHLKELASASDEASDRLILAIFYGKQRDHVRALEQFREALKDEPGNAAAWYEKARVEAKTLDFETAIQDLEKGKESNPKEDLAVEIAKLQGTLYLRNGQSDKALEVWNQLLSNHPDDDTLREDLVELQVKEGLFEEAIETAKALVTATKDPYERVIRQMRLGDIHQRAGDRAKALEAYDGTLEKTGFGTWLEKEVLAQIDKTFRREEDLTGLDEHWTKLVEQYPGRLVLRQRHADLLKELGSNDRAMEQYETILKLTPGERSYREAYVRFLSEADKPEKAIEQMTLLIEANEEDPELLMALARLYQDQKDEANTVATLDKYLEKAEGTEYAYLRIARFYENRLLQEKAAETYAAATKAHPESVAAKEAQAAFLHSSGDKEAALTLWAAMAEDVDRPELVRLARLLSGRGEYEKAFELLQERYDDFENDFIYLGELCNMASSTKRSEEAMPWARHRVALAKTSFDLEAAIEQHVRLANAADRVPLEVKALREKSDRSLAETCLLASLLEMSESSQAADAALASVEPKSPEEERLVISQEIRLQRQRQDWLAAAATTERLFNMAGGRKSATVQQLIRLYTKADEFEKALSWIAEWKKLSPGSKQPWIDESRLLSNLDRPDEVIATLRRAVQQFEGDETLRQELATVYAGQGKMADADRMYWNLYEESEELSDKLRWVGVLAQNARVQGKVDALVEQFEERKETNRNSILPLLSLAEIYRQNYNYEGRRNALLEASQKRPEDLSLLQEIARIEQSEGNPEDALKTLRSALPLDKTDKTKIKIAQIHLEQGREDEGFAILEELAGGTTIAARDAESLADSMIAAYRFDRAIRFLEPLIDKYPDDYRLAYLYAVSLEEEWRTKEALEVFLRLLRVDTEIPGYKPPTQTTHPAYVHMMGMSGSKVSQPPGLAELQKQTQVAYQAYQYRESSRRRSYSSFGYGGQSMAFVQLPPKVESLMSFALAHVQQLCVDLSEAELAEIHAILKGQGFHFPELTLTLASRGQQIFDYEELFAKYPDDETLLAFWAQRPSVDQWDLGRAEKAFDLFEKDFPDLSIGLSVNALMLNLEGGEALFEKGLAAVDRIEEPSAMLIQRLSRLLATQGNRASLITDEATRERLTNLFTGWYPKLEDPMKASLFPVMVSTLAEGEDLAPLIEYLDEEIVRTAAAKNKAQAGVYSHIYYGGRGGQLMEPLTFPPTLSTVPPQISLVIVPPANGQRGYWLFSPPEKEALMPHLEKAKNPYLALLIAYRCEAHERAEKLIQEMVGAEAPELDSFLIAAAYLAERDELDRAGELLLKANYLPIGKQERAQMDSALLAWGIEAEPDSVARERAKDAALRLRRQALTAQHRQELASAMETLGMEEEAAGLLASVANTGMGMSASYRGGSRQANKSRIEKLVDADRFDQAVRVAYQELKRLAATYLQPTRMNNSLYEAREVVQPLQAFSLTQDVLKLLEVTEDANPRELAQTAMIHEMFGEKEKAIELFKKALEKRPKDDASLMRLFLLTAEREPEEASELLLKIRPQLFGNLGNSLSNLLGNARTMKKRLAIAQAIVDYLGSLEKSNRTSLTWVPQVVLQLAQQYYGDEVRLPSMYARHEENLGMNQDDEELKKKVEAVREQRREMHEKLCRAMLKVPSLTLEGFRHLTAVPLFRGEENEEYLTLAKEALISYRAGPNNHSYWSNNDNQVPFVSPEDYLVEQLWKQKKLEVVTTEIVPALKDARQRNAVRSLEDYVSLLTGTEDTFLENAKKVLKAGQASQSSRGTDEPARRVIKGWGIRELEIPLDELLIPRIEQQKARHQRPTFIEDYMEGLAARGLVEEQGAFLEEVATIYLGPKEKRQEFIDKHFISNSVSSGTPNADIHHFSEMLQQLGRRQGLTFLAAEHARLNGLDRLERFRYSHPLNSLSQGNTADPKKALEILEASPWLGPLESFHVYPIQGQRGTYLNQWLSNVRNHDEVKEALTKRLAEVDPPTFGSIYMGIRLDEKDQPKKMAEHLTQHAEALKALEDAHRAEFVTVLTELFPSADPEMDLSEEAKLFLQEFRQMGGDGPDQKVADFLAQNPNRAATNRDITSKTQTLIRDLLTHYPEEQKYLEQAVKIFHFTTDAIERAKKSGRWGRSYGSDRTDAGYLLRSIVQQGSATPNLVVFPLEILAQPLPSGKFVELERYTHDQIIRNLGTHFSRAASKREKAEELKSGSLEGLQAAYERLETMVGERPFELVFHAVIRLLGEVNNETQEDFVDWLETEHPDKLLAKEAAMAVRFSLGWSVGRDDKKFETPEALAVELAHYKAHLENAERPLSWRLPLAYRIVNGQNNYHHPEINLAATAVLEASWNDADTIVSVDYSKPIIDAFMRIRSEDEAWTAQASRLIEAWLYHQRQLSLKNNNRHSSSYDSGQLTILKLATSQNAEEAMNKLLSDHSETLGQTAAALLFLIQEGQPARAKSLLRRSWQNMQPTYGEETFTPVLNEQLPAFLELVEEPDLRFLAELVVAFAPFKDTKEGGDEPVDPEEIALPQRLALAEKFETIEFSNNLLRERCLFVLAKDYRLAESLVAPMQALLTELEIESIMRVEDSRLREQRVEVLAYAIGHAAAQGNSQPFLDNYQKLLDFEEGQSYYRRQAVDHISKQLIDGASSAWKSWDQEKFKTFLPAFIKNVFVDKKSFVSRSALELRVPAVFIAHALAGELEAFEAVVEGAKNPPSELDRLLAFPNLATLLGTALPVDVATKERRWEIVERLWAHSRTGYRVDPTGSTSHYLKRLVDAKVITVDECLEKGADKAWLTAHAREGHTARELCEFLANEKEVSKRTDGFWTLSLSQSLGKPHYPGFIRGHAEYLKQAERSQEALFTLTLASASQSTKAREQGFGKLGKEIRAQLEAKGEPATLLENAVATLKENPEKVEAWAALAAHYHVQGLDEKDLEKRSGYYNVSNKLALAIQKRFPDYGGLPVKRWTKAFLETELERESFGETRTLVEKGSEWHYLDDGSDQGTAWRAADFDDSSWESGPAQLGYGDDDEATVLKEEKEDGKRYITAYFRKDIEATTNASDKILIFDLVRDDGAAVYLNGEEVLRDHLHSGEISFNTTALQIDNELENEFAHFIVPADLLLAEKNVLAVEVHQSRLTSSDLSFDLQVRASTKSHEDLLNARGLTTLGIELPDLVTTWLGE